MTSGPYRLFDVTGIELEYMIAGRETLDVRPVCDRLMERACGAPESEIERGDLAWSNELALHVVELKTNGPASQLEGLAERFYANVLEIDALLEPLGARLLPTSMHPWMNPENETRLWPHEHSAIYRLYDQIFDCRGHGWSNLQSTHINLPFRGDEEFGRLHAAVRLILPLLPALAASSPFVEGSPTGYLDNRLRFYQTNQERVPIVAGRIIPEPVFSEEDYRTRIFQPMRLAISPYDPEGLLDPHFLNSRGAIARFDRGAIEIRLLDLQECPRADLAVVSLVIAVLKAMTEEEFAALPAQQSVGVDPLHELLRETVRHGGEALVEDRPLRRALGLDGTGKAARVWARLAERSAPYLENQRDVEALLSRGNLARQMLDAAGGGDRDGLRSLMGRLGECLAGNEFFTG